MTNVNRRTHKPYVSRMVDSPVGRLTLVATDKGLAAVLWENDSPRRVRLHIGAEDEGHPVLVEAGRQLAEYFAGRRKAFTLTLDVEGTAFQRQVWNALLAIPFGETCGARRRRRKWQESALNRRAVPSRRRVDRQVDRIRRRSRRQGAPAGARRRAMTSLT